MADLGIRNGWDSIKMGREQLRGIEGVANPVNPQMVCLNSHS